MLVTSLKRPREGQLLTEEKGSLQIKSDQPSCFSGEDEQRAPGNVHTPDQRDDSWPLYLKPPHTGVTCGCCNKWKGRVGEQQCSGQRLQHVHMCKGPGKRAQWGPWVDIPTCPLETQLFYWSSRCSSLKYDCLLFILRSVHIAPCLLDKPCAGSEAMFHSFTHSSVLSIIFPLSSGGHTPPHRRCEDYFLCRL